MKTEPKSNNLLY